MLSYRIVLSALILGVAPLAAQDPTRVFITQRPMAPGYKITTDAMPSRRGVIGVGVDLRPSPNDSIGATLTTVTPGGAAAGAGLLAGDIITKFNGTALVERGRHPADDRDGPDQSQPGLKLLELASHMSPGDTVAVEWKHERQRKTAQLVAQSAATVVFSNDGTPGPDVRFFQDGGPGRFGFNFVTPDRPDAVAELQGRLEALREPLAMGGMPGMNVDRVFIRMGGPLGGVQFAPLNADLGRYFGTTDGILVLDTPDSSAHVDLKGGDVILAVGDRKPANVEHLLRILASYQDDEVVHFDVMRDHRRMTVDAKASDLQSDRRVDFFDRRTAPADDQPPPPRPEPRRRRSGT